MKSAHHYQYIFLNRKFKKLYLGNMYVAVKPLPPPRAVMGGEKLSDTLDHLISWYAGESENLIIARAIYLLRKRSKLCRNHFIRARFVGEFNG